MKHAINLSTIILASIFAVVACEKENAPKPEYQTGETVTITATLPSVPATDPATKVDFTQGTNKVDLAWSTGDALTIIGEDTSESQTFTLSGISGSKANFTGTAVSGSSFTVLYPGTVTSVAAMDAKSFTGQTQTGNESLAHLTGAWTAKVTGLSDFSDVKFAAPAGGTFAQSGILKFYIQVPDVVTTVKGVGIEAPSAVFYADNASTKAASLDLTLSGVTLDAKHAFTAYMALSQKNSEAVAAGEKVKVKFTDSYDNVWEKEITLTTSFVLQAGKVNVITLDKSAWNSTGRYAGGTGVDGDPWLITEPIHMQHMAADLVSGETKYFKMMADVDMSGETWTPMNDDNTKAVDFNGNNKTISGLASALFSYLDGKVYDLTLSGVSLSDVGSYYGSLARTIEKDGCEITNVSASGSISGGVSYVGGLIGRIADGVSACALTDCSSNVAVEATTFYTGGLVGYVDNGTFTRCSASGNVTNTRTNYSHVGGLIGYIKTNATLTNCHYTSGTITASGQNAGGLIGNMAAGSVDGCYTSGTISTTNQIAGGLIGLLANGDVQNCHSSATVTTTKYYAAGLIGKFAPSDGETHTLQSCYATGNVSTASHYAGGLVGQVDKKVQIKKCYSTGDIVTTAASTANHGGIVAHILGTAVLAVENCYSTGHFGTDTYPTRRWCGGILGTTASGAAITVTNCYSSFTITSANIGLEGALVGNNGSTTLTSSGYIGWSSLANMAGAGTAVDVTGNYLGTEGTISGHATTLGWSGTIWDLSGSTPTLK